MKTRFRAALPPAALVFLGLLLANCSGAFAPAKQETKAPEKPATVLEEFSGRDSLGPHAIATRAALRDSGAVLFRSCAICHGGNGRGGRGPTLANSDYVMGDRERLIRTVLFGVRDSIRVNGVRWKTGEMLGWADTYNDFQIAAVLTYVRTALNDSLVTSCIPEDIEAGTWASCNAVARNPSQIATDSISVQEVTEVRFKPNLRPK